MTELYHKRTSPDEVRTIRLNLIAVKELLPEFRIDHFDDIDQTARRVLERRFALYQKLGGKVQTAFGGWERKGGQPPRIDHLPSKEILKQATKG